MPSSNTFLTAGERVSRVALDVFGTAAFKEQLRVGYDYLLGAKIPVQHAAYRQSSFVKGQIRQGGKGAPLELSVRIRSSL